MYVRYIANLIDMYLVYLFTNTEVTQDLSHTRDAADFCFYHIFCILINILYWIIMIIST